MTKNLKLSYILIAVAAAIVIAWRTLYQFFSGGGITFVALLTIVTILVCIILNDKYTFNRIKDLFITTCVFAGLEILMFFALEFITDNVSHVQGFFIYQNVLSILGIFYFTYIAFRFITEFKGVKIGFVEFILGNGKTTKKPKKDKELENGTLENKPNANHEEQSAEPLENVHSSEIVTNVDIEAEPETKDEE